MTNIRHRILSAILMISMISSMIVLSPPAMAAETGTVSRSAWISRIVSEFEMTVEDTTTMPDNYFSDLTSDSECYEDVLLAVEFGVIDLEAGGAFRPDDPATREFAAQTLNHCLGFQTEGAGYSYSDSGDVAEKCRDAAQVAVDRGWFALIDGAFCPQQPVTEAEMEAMMADAKAVMSQDVVEGSENTFTVADGVTVVPESAEVSIDTAGNLTISGYSGTIKQGDIFVVTLCGYPMAYQAAAVSVSDTGILVSTQTNDETDAAITSVTSKGSSEIDLEQFEVAGEATYYVTDTSEGGAGTQTLSIAPQSVDYDKKNRTLTIKEKVALGGSTAGTITVTLTNLKMTHSVEGAWLGGVSSACVSVTSNADVTAAVKFDLSDYAGIPSSLPLGYINAGPIVFSLSMEYSMSGGMSATWSGNMDVGISYYKDSGVRFVRSFEKKTFTVTTEVDLKVGMRAQAEFNLGLAQGHAWLGAGVKGKFSASHYDSGTPSTCVTLYSYLYAEAGYYAEVGVGKGLSKTWQNTYDIYDRTNSPVRTYYHWEDDELVAACTRDAGSTPYYTSPDSPYFSPGPSHGSGSYSVGGVTAATYTYKVKTDSNTNVEYASITGYTGNPSILVIPSTLDGYPVREIASDAFESKTNLRAVTFPDTVTTIGSWAFSGCTKLSDVHLPAGLKTLGHNAFYKCTALTEIEIPKSLDTAGSGNIGPFDESGLTTVTFEQGTTKVVSNLFSGAGNLKNVTFLDTMTSIGDDAFYNCVALTEIALPDSLTSIGYETFRGCTGLTAVTIPDTVTTIGSWAFSLCSKLSDVQLPAGLKTLGNDAFYKCTALTEIEIPESINKIASSVFQYAGLTRIVIPGSCKTIGSNAFSDCVSLETVEIRSGVTELGSYVFENCAALKAVSLPDTLTTIGSYAFRNCDALTDITIPNSVKKLGDYAFESCDALSGVVLSTGFTAIPQKAFYACPALQSVLIPYRVTSIADYAFANCTGLTDVTIPQSVTSIASTAFSYPDKLTIHGVSGSYAETFANNNGFTFVSETHPATAVTLDKTELSMTKGSSVKLVASIEPADFTDTVVWRSTDTAVATVANDGTVKAVAVGTAKIQLVVGNVRAVCTVTVTQPVTSISLNKTSLSMEATATYQLTATANPAAAQDRTVSWKSSDPEIASVDGTGLVTAHAKGTATITATANDGSGVYRNCTVTVTNTAYVVSNPTRMESSHPYANNCTDIWLCTIEDAAYIEITFDGRTDIDDGFDFLYIFDAGGAEIGKYTGTELANQTVRVPGNTVKIKLVSDGAVTAWGFKVSGVNTDGTLDAYEELLLRLAGLNTPENTASQIVSGVQALDPDQLLAAVQDEKGGAEVRAALSELEKAAKIGTLVTISPDMASSFRQEDIGVVGAALNIARVNEGTENTVTLAIAAPEGEHELEQRYQSVLAFSMKLENVVDRLIVPVQITLPVPDAANTDTLVLFRYQDDGTREEVPYTLTTVDGQPYVTFVATAFGDFQFAEGSGYLPGDVDQNGVVDIIDLQRLYAHLNGTNPLGDDLLRGDVDGNGTVDIVDLQRLYAHLNGSNPLF